MTNRNIIRLIAAAALSATALAQQRPPTRQVYLDLAKEAYRHSLRQCPAAVEKWIKSDKDHPLFGYAPPGGPVWLAGLAASLYELTGDNEYAATAVEWLAQQHRFKQYFPESLRQARVEYRNGLPTLTDFFHLPTFAQAYLRIKDHSAVTAEKRAQIERSIAESADFILHFPEWGPMNRAILRAEGLAFAAAALPDHPHTSTWRTLARVLASDSWGHWEQEDAQIYLPVWLHALMRYADILGDESLYELHTTRYYCDYFLHLLSPAGMVPAFGVTLHPSAKISDISCP
jgi:hypothetical protein